MDFPLDLSQGFVTGKDELCQTIILLLKNGIYSFLQSSSIGSKVSIHSTDKNLISMSVKKTLEQIQNLSVESISVNSDETDVTVIVQVNYRGDFYDFTFSL